MDNAMLEEVLTEWDNRVNQIKLFNTPEMLSFGNVNVAIERFRGLAQFLQYYVPLLQDWTTNYIKAHRAEIFTWWWMEHINKWVVSHGDPHSHIKYLHPNAKAEWDNIFGQTEFCFSIAEQVAKATKEKLPISQCDEPRIVAIHEPYPHKYDWDHCWYCDDQEREWSKELKRRILQSDHPLLNLDYTVVLNRPELDGLGEWEPPHKWSNEYADVDEYKEYIRIQRSMKTDKPGQTPYQIMKRLVPEMLSHSGWVLSHSYKRTPYDRFIQLWNTLDLVLHCIRIDLPRLVELEHV